jgi:two-component system, NarL family, nitrate/nitrite response regulator NarL
MAESMEQTIEILLVDDHALFRQGVARLLETELACKVVACGSIKEGLAVLRQRQIDIVLLDFDLGQRDGTRFVRLAKEQGFKGKILVVTAGVEESEAAELIRVGISGIFMKHNSAALLAQGIRDVMAGKVWFDQELLQATLHGSARPPLPEPQSERFTPRERQVLSYVFEGLANKEIASRIGVSESSVKATLQQLFSKTGVHTRGQLIRIALEQDWTQP